MARKNIQSVDGIPMRAPQARPRQAIGVEGIATPTMHATTTMRKMSTNPRRKAVLRKKPDNSVPVHIDKNAVHVNRKPSSKGVPVGLSRDSIAKEKARLQSNKDFLSPVSTLDLDLSSKELRADYSLKHRNNTHETPRQKIGQKSKGKKKHTVRKILIAFLILLIIGVGAFMVWGNDIIAKLTGGRSNIFTVLSAIGSNVELKTDSNGRTNILIFGTSGYDMSGSEGDGAHDGAQLTDSIMLVSVDQKNDDVAMVSLPRDLYVGHTCTATGKVNEIYYCANLSGTDEESGAQALSQSMKEILGTDIQYYIHLDWAALVQVVDSIGGITVTLDEDIEDNWTGTFIKAGEPVSLNGERALGLARARHGTEMGDFTRGNSQQKILGAIQQKITSSGLDLGSALGLIDAVGDNVRMNFTLEELKTAFSIAKDVQVDSMRQIPLIDYKNNIVYLKTAEMNGISYVVPVAGASKYSDIHEYVAKMTSNNPAVREGANILVLNGSGVAGSASAEQSVLTKEGFTSVDTGDAPNGTYSEKYYVYDISGNTPETVSALSSHYKVSSLPATELPAGINSAGYDVVIILGGATE